MKVRCSNNPNITLGVEFHDVNHVLVFSDSPGKNLSTVILSPCDAIKFSKKMASLAKSINPAPVVSDVKIVTDVRKCARCGGDHNRIEFKRFKDPPPNYSHWALCPDTHEPILMSVVTEEE